MTHVLHQGELRARDEARRVPSLGQGSDGVAFPPHDQDRHAKSLVRSRIGARGAARRGQQDRKPVADRLRAPLDDQGALIDLYPIVGGLGRIRDEGAEQSPREARIGEEGGDDGVAQRPHAKECLHEHGRRVGLVIAGAQTQRGVHQYERPNPVRTLEGGFHGRTATEGMSHQHRPANVERFEDPEDPFSLVLGAIGSTARALRKAEGRQVDGDRAEPGRRQSDHGLPPRLAPGSGAVDEEHGSAPGRAHLLDEDFHVSRFHEAPARRRCFGGGADLANTRPVAEHQQDHDQAEQREGNRRERPPSHSTDERTWTTPGRRTSGQHGPETTPTERSALTFIHSPQAVRARVRAWLFERRSPA